MYRSERKSYHDHRQKARSKPNEYICIIVDGMDQNKTNLPCLRKTSKTTSGLYRLRTHLTGVIDHTKCDYGKQVSIFVDILQWPHDSNLTISIINRVLCSHIEQTNGQLPPVLYVQMDNTSRENKNKFVLGYFSYLIEAGVFTKVFFCNAQASGCISNCVGLDKGELSPSGTHPRGCGPALQQDIPAAWSSRS